MDNQKYRITYKIGDNIKTVIMEARSIGSITEGVDLGFYHFIHVNEDMILNPNCVLKIEKFEVNPKRKPKNDHPGVTWDKTNKVWKVRVYIGGKQVNVGSSTDFETAMKIKKDAEVGIEKALIEDINRTN